MGSELLGAVNSNRSNQSLNQSKHHYFWLESEPDFNSYGLDSFPRYSIKDWWGNFRRNQSKEVGFKTGLAAF